MQPYRRNLVPEIAPGANLTPWGNGVATDGKVSNSVIDNFGTLTIKPWTGEICRFQ
jgi:hypothetical protein